MYKVQINLQVDTKKFADLMEHFIDDLKGTGSLSFIDGNYDDYEILVTNVTGKVEESA